MSHYTQKERKRRLQLVREWRPNISINQLITRCILQFGCSRRKAIEYIAEVTRE